MIFSVQWGVPTVSAAGVFGEYDDIDNDSVYFKIFTLDNNDIVFFQVSHWIEKILYIFSSFTLGKGS